MGNSEESDANLYDKNTHQTVNYFYGQSVINFSVLYQKIILNSKPQTSRLLLTLYRDSFYYKILWGAGGGGEAIRRDL